MCGIAGIYTFKEEDEDLHLSIKEMTSALNQRGPDNEGIVRYPRCSLGHCRLSILDITAAGHQPMHDVTERFSIIYNGEVYNFKTLRNELEAQGSSFHTQTDTEVILQGYIVWGQEVFSKLNGFFAVAIYERDTERLILARDRFGIKPLYYFQDDRGYWIASEMKALFRAGIPKKINQSALYNYLQLNYVPGEASMVEGVHKIQPGCGAILSRSGVDNFQFYDRNSLLNLSPFRGSYEEAQAQLYRLMEEAVQDRMVSDVPLGAFLSGGIDSSVITGLASQHTRVKTFSIGYKDEPFFDETAYAELVAKKFNTDHTTFQLTTNDLLEGLYNALNYLDEPFADSSALAVNILSRETRKHVTVSLSGDGADELFAGYMKHAGEFRARNKGFSETMVGAMAPLWKALPKSRNGKISNRIRQFDRFAQAQRLSAKERYWRLATTAGEHEIALLYRHRQQALERASQEKHRLLANIQEQGDFNEFLHVDTTLLLPGDMLTKVDRMSMLHSLEVRVPFLDRRVVDFAFSLPTEFKINRNMKKRILQDTFRQLLPAELYNRPKHGFDVPLLRWLRTDLDDLLRNDLFHRDFVEAQGLFHYEALQKLLSRLHSKDPGDSHVRIWGLLVFQWWYKKYGFA